MTEKRFTVPLKYSLSHSKIQCDGEPLTNDELVRILNTNEGAFLENFNLKKENEQLKQFQQEVARVIESKMGDNVCNDYKMEVLKEIWDELNLDEVWFE